MLHRVDVLAEAVVRGFLLEERPLRGRWYGVGGAVTTRGGRAS
jgi:hypothetical protein